MDFFLDCLDQFRYITGILLIIFLTCSHVLPRRKHLRIRIIAGYLVALVLALSFVPLKYAVADYIQKNPLITAPYWLMMSFVPVGFVLLCYETNLAGALYRTMVGSFVENFATVLIRYLFVGCLFPDYPQKHPVLYGLFMVGTYALIYVMAYVLMCRRIKIDESDKYPNPKTAGYSYLFIYVSYTAVLGTTKVVCENVILPLASDYAGIYRSLQYFLVADMLLINVIMGVVMIYFYSIVTLRNEQQVIMQMLSDRQAQYEFSKENIAMINQKAHDLKHQLRALERVTFDERREQIRETRMAIDFYDAVVKTGNDALDTLLTEKSVYCQNRNIRLSCTVNTRHLERISVVDLYTLLGNAIDNAIESVDKLEDTDKKVISLTIRDQGQMLFFQIENYYDGKIRMDQGLPMTSKKDRWNHGFGTRSIQSIANRYGGSMMIQTENQIFSLEILIPA